MSDRHPYFWGRSLSCFIEFGQKDIKNRIKRELVETPIMLSGMPMQQEEKAKYLGDYLCGSGLTESVSASINSRRGIVTRAIFEIRAVIDDIRSREAGGLSAGLDIWNMAVLPMLIYNAECWFVISRKDITELEKMQNLFLRSLLAVGSGCPTAALYSETGTILIEYRILMKKLLFLHHVVSLNEGSLAREVYEVQSKLKLPGLVEECQMFLDRFLWVAQRNKISGDR